MSGSQTFSLWLLQVIVLSALLIFLLWLSLRPSDPTYVVIDLTMPSILSGNTTSNNTDTASLWLEISNDNKGGGVRYSEMNATIYLDGQSAGATTMPSFYQGHGKTTQRNGLVRTGARRSWDRTASVDVGLATAVRYKIWPWKSGVHRMNMEASVPIGGDGKFSGKKSKMIKMHRKIKKWRLRR